MTALIVFLAILFLIVGMFVYKYLYLRDEYGDEFWKKVEENAWGGVEYYRRYFDRWYSLNLIPLRNAFWKGIVFVVRAVLGGLLIVSVGLRRVLDWAERHIKKTGRLLEYNKFDER